MSLQQARGTAEGKNRLLQSFKNHEQALHDYGIREHLISIADAGRKW